MTGFTLRSVKGSALTQTEMDANWSAAVSGVDLAASTGSALVGFIQSGTGAVARTLQAKSREIFSVTDFGAVGDAVTDDSSAIQSAINALNGGVGGTLRFHKSRYNLGTTGITTYPNVRLVGDSQAYVSGTRGVELLYSGTGTALAGTNILNGGIENISIDATNATGASVKGIYLSGLWLTDLKGVRVKGVTPAKGYGILIDTNGTYGAQHNYLEKVECSDGIVRFSGQDASNQVTTTVVNVLRGTQYEASHASVIFIDATAEKSGTIATGFAFSNTGTSLMIGCDIEGAYTTGISQANSHTVRELGTVWDGFTGTTRTSGSFGESALYNAGIGLINVGQTVASMKAIRWNDINADYVKLIPSANNVTGGSQDGHLVLQRNIAGSGLINQVELRNNLRLEHSLSIANVATTVLTIPIATNRGIRVQAHAEGIQTGAGVFSVHRQCVAINNAGTVTHTDDAELEVDGGGSAAAFTFTASTTNLLVQFNHASATPTTINFVIKIDGPVFSYTKA